MLIIFDLDDTLIDTSGCITPFKLRVCLQKLVEDGLFLTDFEAAYKRLLTLDRMEGNARAALQKLVEEAGKDRDFVSGVFDLLTSPLPKDFVVKVTPGAREALRDLKEDHQLLLVTIGDLAFQMEKLEKAGIDRAIFSNIAVPGDSNKKPFYERFIQEFSVHPEDVVVCGDRVDRDLRPAFELGMRTVHMRHGRGRSYTQDWVQHQIQNLSELKRMIEHDNS